MLRNSHDKQKSAKQMNRNSHDKQESAEQMYRNSHENQDSAVVAHVKKLTWQARVLRDDQQLSALRG